MMLILDIIILTIFASASRSLYLDLEDNILPFFNKPLDSTKSRRLFLDDIRLHAAKDPNNFERVLMSDSDLSHSRKHAKAKDIAASKAEVFNRASDNDLSRTKIEEAIPKSSEQQSQLPRKGFQIDPVLNSLRIGPAKYRRANSKSVSTSSGSSSSSREIQNWKDEWRDVWLQKKFEATNTTLPPMGDHINMVAARPWGVPCGDPNQHDMPWGSCMLPLECEPEYRIYRGDYFCGRTQFICCALQSNIYDLYQGFDASLADSSFDTDSDEESDGKNSNERKRDRKRRDRKKRRKNRSKRKRKIKRIIRKIVKEISKVLNKSFRNGTTAKKKKTKQLKKFIEYLKDQYKRDRKSMKTIHEQEMIKIDAELQKRLEDIKKLNQRFVQNQTFREIAINGSISKAGARELVQSYPEVGNYIQYRRRNARRPKDYLDYDIEYGLLYY